MLEINLVKVLPSSAQPKMPLDRAAGVVRMHQAEFDRTLNSAWQHVPVIDQTMVKFKVLVTLAH